MKKNNKQMNMFKLFGLLLMGIIIALVPNLNINGINTVYAYTENETEAEISKLDKKKYYEGSVEDDFADDMVIIVLNEQETHKFKTYAPEDFSEIDCVSVKDLTA